MSQLASEGLAIETYTYDIEDGVPQICGADELLPIEMYQYDLDLDERGASEESQPADDVFSLQAPPPDREQAIPLH